VTASVTEEASDRVGATRREWSAKNVEFRHGL
jgi:hypothetical protein